MSEHEPSEHESPGRLGASPLERGVDKDAPHSRRTGVRARNATMAGVVALGAAGLVVGSVALSRSPGSAATVPRVSSRSQLASASSKVVAPGAQITVTGSGQVEGTPDTATFSIGINTTAPSATSALDENNAQVAQLTSVLEAQGLAAKDIQTSWLNLYTNTNQQNVVTGFAASDQLSVTSHDLSHLGAVLDAAVHASGNGVSLGGITFSISNDSGLLAAARAQAMLAARTQADQLAAGDGVALGPVVKVVDQENSNSSQGYVNGGFASAAYKAAVPINAGSQQISVQVTVVYGLQA